MIFCIDIDGIIVDTLFDGSRYTTRKVNVAVVNKINKLHVNGDIVILHTGRHWDKLMETKEMLKRIGLFYTTLVCGKPVADYYVDDKNLSIDDFMNIN
jgi:hydroxymethylpyrimidine pyrophosphatase-like HAD family hydrolase